jgi:hypothetical protein
MCNSSTVQSVILSEFSLSFFGQHLPAPMGAGGGCSLIYIVVSRSNTRDLLGVS